MYAIRSYYVLYNLMEGFFAGWLRLYEKSLNRVLRLRRTILVLIILLTLGTLWLFTRIPTGLFPPDDVGSLRATTEGIQGASFEEMQRNQAALAEIRNNFV